VVSGGGLDGADVLTDLVSEVRSSLDLLELPYSFSQLDLMLAEEFGREGSPDGSAGLLVTLSRFTDPAIAEAGKLGIELIDNREFLQRIAMDMHYESSERRSASRSC
jgi:hypothetical protein